MTRLYNDSDDFVDEMIEGLTLAADGRLVKVRGGVVTGCFPDTPTVSLVIGGGSGHYPAFGGLVGPGLAHGAALGNVFASPSAQQVYDVARSSDQGRGVLLSYGNYAGDVLNFSLAEQRLREDGLDVRTVLVTDDVASAPPAARERRRGIAGDLVVFKVAGAAAERGLALDQVERIARRANDRTRSFGVAFSGCTLPGADAPLFEVPEGRMALGLGIHGEPGIGEADVPTARELAELLVDALLPEAPADAAAQGRVVVLLNGLGAVKADELFVLYRSVAEVLAGHGLTVVEPEVGELCTSFDMAGCSLTLCWLDDELEELWRAPADAHGYRKAARRAGRPRAAIPVGHVVEAGTDAPAPRASPDSQRAAAELGTVFDAIDAALTHAAGELGRLDAVAGDGDHGIGMQRGAAATRDAVWKAIETGCGAGTTLRRGADAWGDRAGGTSGALWACLLRAMGEVVGDEHAVDRARIVAAVTAAQDAITAFGGAQVGDKTMVDAVVPFVSELSRYQAGETFAERWSTAARRAAEAAQATADLTASLGRARAHGDASVGTPDPGAVSFALVCEAVGRVFDEGRLERDRLGGDRLDGDGGERWG